MYYTNSHTYVTPIHILSLTLITNLILVTFGRGAPRRLGPTGRSSGAVRVFRVQRQQNKRSDTKFSTFSQLDSTGFGGDAKSTNHESDTSGRAV